MLSCTLLLASLLTYVVPACSARDTLGQLDKSTLPPAKAKWIQDYFFTWGDENLSDDGTAVVSIVDQEKKGGGWSSRQPWIHGIFSAMIKMPAGQSCGVVSAFYLTSEWNMSWTKDFHDEIDFEILGNDGNGNVTMQTNYFVGGEGGHEERFKLWFDPTLDFHEYKFQVNKEAVRWYIDGILVREITAETPGGLPKTSMFLVASVWDGSYWVPCTLGRKERVLDYSKGPFTLSFKNMSMTTCYWRQQVTKEPPPCANPQYTYPWDGRPGQKDRNIMKHVKDHYMFYTWENRATWNRTSLQNVEVVHAREERTAKELFDLETEGHVIRGNVRSADYLDENVD